MLSLLLFVSLSWSAEKLMITGSSTMAPLIAELAKVYQKNHKDLKIEVQTGGSAKGISDCRDRLNDIGMVSRSLEPNEQDIQANPIAKDGLALIVNKKNPVQNITRDQVIQIYTGQIKNWKQLGGANEKIVVVSKAEGRAALDLFLHSFGLKASQIKAEVIIGDEEQGIKTVAGSPAAIAYISVSSVDGPHAAGLNVHSLMLEGRKPTSENVRKGEYQLSRFLNLVSCGQQKKSVTDFVRFVTSKIGQQVIQDLNYIPLK